MQLTTTSGRLSFKDPPSTNNDRGNDLMDRRSMINSWLTKTTTLAFLLLTFMALMLGFRIFTEATGGITLDTILDTIGPVSDAQALLASMSEAQKLAHFRLTLWLDMLFPLAYGGLFAGLTLRYFQLLNRDGYDLYDILGFNLLQRVFAL